MARLAFFVERIAAGTPAGSIPVELPTMIETAVNLRTARELGLSVPPTIVLRADEMIE